MAATRPSHTSWWLQGFWCSILNSKLDIRCFEDTTASRRKFILTTGLSGSADAGMNPWLLHCEEAAESLQLSPPGTISTISRLIIGHVQGCYRLVACPCWGGDFTTFIIQVPNSLILHERNCRVNLFLISHFRIYNLGNHAHRSVGRIPSSFAKSLDRCIRPEASGQRGWIEHISFLLR